VWRHAFAIRAKTTQTLISTKACKAEAVIAASLIRETSVAFCVLPLVDIVKFSVVVAVEESDVVKVSVVVAVEESNVVVIVLIAAALVVVINVAIVRFSGIAAISFAAPIVLLVVMFEIAVVFLAVAPFDIVAFVVKFVDAASPGTVRPQDRFPCLVAFAAAVDMFVVVALVETFVAETIPGERPIKESFACVAVVALVVLAFAIVAYAVKFANGAEPNEVPTKDESPGDVAITDVVILFASASFVVKFDDVTMSNGNATEDELPWVVELEAVVILVALGMPDVEVATVADEFVATIAAAAVVFAVRLVLATSASEIPTAIALISAFVSTAGLIVCDALLGGTEAELNGDPSVVLDRKSPSDSLQPDGSPIDVYSFPSCVC